MIGLIDSLTSTTLKWPEKIKHDYGIVETDVTRMFHVDYLTSMFRDFSRPNMYRMEINLADGGYYEFTNKSHVSKIEMLAKSANIPNYEISKLEIRRMGARIQLPSSQNYGELQVVFLSDDVQTQRKFLHAWMKHFVYDSDENTYARNHKLLGSDIYLYQLNNRFEPVFGIHLDLCWPTLIGEIQYSQDSENQIVEFPVTFAYSTYKIVSNVQDEFKLLGGLEGIV